LSRVIDTLKSLFKFDGPSVAIIFRDLLIALTICIIAAQFGRYFYIFDLTTHFLIQYMVGCIVIGTFFIYRRDKKKAIWCAVILAACLFNFFMSPRPEFAQMNLTSAPTFNIVQYNKNLVNQNYDEMRKALIDARADIVIFQEAIPDDEALPVKLGDAFPYHISAPKMNAFGMIVLSRYPIQNETQHVTSEGPYGNFVLELSVRPSGFKEDVTIYALHAVPPIQNDFWEHRNGELAAAAKIVSANPSPQKIMIGDWNTSPYSPFFADIIQTTHLNYTSSLPFAQPTWPAPLSVTLGLMQIPIDHILYGNGLAPFGLTVLEGYGSDHHMVSASFGESR
jgi:endonuclease/exonuclease/phosphatase (EEP) superfamily protein YafD